MRARPAFWLIATLAGGAGHVLAQEGGSQPLSLSLELNGAEPSQRGCRLTSVAIAMRSALTFGK